MQFGHTRPEISPLQADNILKAAESIAKHDDRPSIIFRRFDKLAIANILGLHWELTRIDEYLSSDEYLSGGEAWTRMCGLIKEYRMYLRIITDMY